MFTFAGATKFEGATIVFLTKYDSHLPFGGRAQSESDFFSLNTKTVPPQWTIGKPIRWNPISERRITASAKSGQGSD